MFRTYIECLDFLAGTWGGDAQMGAGLDHEFRLDLEIGPITIYILSRNMRI